MRSGAASVNTSADNGACYWAVTAAEQQSRLGSGPSGLSDEEARRRLEAYGPNQLREGPRIEWLMILLAQFKSPLVLILVFAAIISTMTGDWVDVVILLLIVLASAILGFLQEYHAGRAVERLRRRVRLRAMVIRDGEARQLPAEDLVPGDVVRLSAGSLIPADGILLESNDFFVNQAVLTGETFPVEKSPGVVEADSSLAGRTNCVFTGSTVRTGTALALICRTGGGTEFGQIASQLALRQPETEFEQGIRRFGNMLTRMMGLMMFIVFAINVLLAKPAIDSLLFAVALAVGMAPELLPAIISITLSRGAQSMARRGVIVKKLSAIENFGSMDVLCTDKTGTLTLGVVKLDGAVDSSGQASSEVLRAAMINARFQTGLVNPLDEAILAASGGIDLTGLSKVEEIPYDFVRKRLSVAVGEGGRVRLITKGAFEQVLAVCARSGDSGESLTLLDDDGRERLRRLFIDWSDRGFRVLGVAVREVEPRAEYTIADESEMVFIGFLLFFDPPKQETSRTIEALRGLGVELKIITGDSSRVALHVASEVGLNVRGLLTGAELNRLHDEALWQLADRTTIFAEVDPNQKDRIISALRRTGHVVGYLGDGINDAPALHTADVGVSVENAVDVAREAADFVLLEQSLDVLCQGIEEGRRIFANTLKYVFTTTSANFGNMFSMAGLSLFLPYLPLLPTQILLNNFLSDFPAMTIATDEVDREAVDRPRRWDVRMIRNFMIVFGLISSVFDYLTFGVLLLVLRVGEDEFRTGWFIESLLTELLILLVVRTRHPLLRSRPGRYLWLSTLLVVIVTLVLPYIPMVAGWFQFVPIPPRVMLILIAITIGYVFASEIAKRWFYRREW